MLTYLLCDAADCETRRSAAARRRRLVRDRGQSVRLPNCPTLDLMKIKVSLLGPKITHQTSKLVRSEERNVLDCSLIMPFL